MKTLILMAFLKLILHIKAVASAKVAKSGESRR